MNRFRAALYFFIVGVDAGWSFDYALAGQYGLAIGFGALALIIGAITTLLILDNGGAS